jgi:hypothetical protein
VTTLARQASGRRPAASTTRFPRGKSCSNWAFLCSATVDLTWSAHCGWFYFWCAHCLSVFGWLGWSCGLLSWWTLEGSGLLPITSFIWFFYIIVSKAKWDNEEHIYDLFHLPLSMVASEKLSDMTVMLKNTNVPDHSYIWSFPWKGENYSTNKVYSSLC